MTTTSPEPKRTLEHSSTDECVPIVRETLCQGIFLLFRFLRFAFVWVSDRGHWALRFEPLKNQIEFKQCGQRDPCDPRPRCRANPVQGTGAVRFVSRVAPDPNFMAVSPKNETMKVAGTTLRPAMAGTP